ncbi:putative ribonuclease H-like domain-containing protein [Tanacetum coccineum]
MGYKRGNPLTFLEKHGYKRGTIDKTLFIKRDKKDIILVQVYVDDIIFGSTNKSWYDEFEALMKSRFQMSSMGELTFFLGLQVNQHKGGIFISQDKYVAEILKKFDLVNVKAAITPMETKDEEAFDVYVHLYRSMIGSLMYLTASRPDIMYAVCVCSRFQVTPKTSHLNAVKRIFKYLKGKPNLGLWYPRESPLHLEAFSDSDYGGSNLDRKSTTGGCQFLGQRLISWQCKKQTIVATSTTEAEYVAAANCCGQVLWVQNQLLDYGFNFMNTKIHIDNESTICIVKNPVYHSKTKHIEIRHHFIRDCYEKKLISVEKIHTDLNVADLLTKPFDGPRFNYLVVSIGFAEIGDFLRVQPQCAVKVLEEDGSLEISATVDTKRYIISEASIRDSLQLDDATGITMLPNDDLFAVKLVKKVKKLEGFLKKRNLVLTDSEDEEPEAQGRTGQADPQDSSIQGLVTPPTTKAHASGEEHEDRNKPKHLSRQNSLKGCLFKVMKVNATSIEVNTASKVNTGSIELNTVIEQDSTAGENKGQREGKAPMLSEETPKKTKEQILQEEASLGRAIRWIPYKKKRRLSKLFGMSSSTKDCRKKMNWDLIRAKLEANAELSKSMLGSELQGEDFAKKMVDLVNQRKKFFAEERAKAKRKAMTPKSQLRLT